MSPQTIKPIIWSGEQEFRLVGTNCHEDTLRIESNYPDEKERALKLVLPTLCITYADMKFTNAIGGEQENYPASIVYGPSFFDPPVVISGEEDVEKFTWIRGANRMTIGPEKTVIEWFMGKTLIIPRLRLDEVKPALTKIEVPEARITVDKELIINVMQFGDGRHTGGISVEKRHPKWIPREDPKEYDLWIGVINAETLEPMPEVTLNLFRWDRKARFDLVEQLYTNADGTIHDPKRPSDELEAVTLQFPGWCAVPYCYRPLSGQHKRIQVRAWKLKEDSVKYVWRETDSLKNVALLTGHAENDILSHNKLSSSADLKPGLWIKLPCYAAAYRMDPGDTFKWLAKAFAYSGIDELAEHNKIKDPSHLAGGVDIQLPGWNFFYARGGDSLEQIDKMFGLPPGWSRTIGRVHHPDPNILYESEIIAIPTKEFVNKHFERQPG